MSDTESHTSDVVVYDGDCGICEASARWITSHVPGLRVISHHAHGLEHIDAVLLVSSGGNFEGAVAVAAILGRARSRFLRIIGVLMGLPVIRTLAGVVYGLVARNRRRLSRMLGLRACAIDVAGKNDTVHR